MTFSNEHVSLFSFSPLMLTLDLCNMLSDWTITHRNVCNLAHDWLITPPCINLHKLTF